MKLSMQAYAKINLGLRITAKRSDGYHDLLTIFQRISLADIVSLEKLKSEIVYDGPILTDKPENNLCCRAAASLKNYCGRELGVKISLKKQIPVGAGLGGGSSDAAAVINGMAKLYGITLDNNDLLSISTAVGSDVPFFASGFSAAFGQGRGEKLKQVDGLKSDYWILVIKPNFEVSTALAYKLLDDHLTFDENNIRILFHQFLRYRGGLPKAEMHNDFEEPIFAVHPRLNEARDKFLSAGCESVGLCGSGSALYGVFKDGDRVRAVAGEFEPPWLKYICHPI